MTSQCQHGELHMLKCDECVTVICMALGVLDRAVIEEVTTLADSYADRVIEDMPSVDAETLREGLAGAFLVFLRDVAVLVAQHSE